MAVTRLHILGEMTGHLDFKLKLRQFGALFMIFLSVLSWRFVDEDYGGQ